MSILIFVQNTVMQCSTCIEVNIDKTIHLMTYTLVCIGICPPAL